MLTQTLSYSKWGVNLAQALVFVFKSLDGLKSNSESFGYYLGSGIGDEVLVMVGLYICIHSKWVGVTSVFGENGW